MMLADKRLLITGVATTGSIAHATAVRCLDQGAQIVLTAFPRDFDDVAALAHDLDPAITVLPLDLTDGAQVDDVARSLAADGRPFHGALHAVAFAPKPALDGDMVDAGPEGIELAFRTSAWSLTALAGLLARLTPPSGGALVGLDFDADDRAWPTYNWMGVCKAAMRSSARYLARDLGPAGIRVNLVAAGPLRTRAAGAIPGFDLLEQAWQTTSPLPWDVHDPAPVADVAAFLLSDGARAITAEVLHVDGGFHAMATALRS